MKQIALFPLNLVVYPFEKLNLHIFEPRYKQLIKECIDSSQTFGIPVFINNKIEMFGTEMKIVNVERIYEDERMDIRTEGINIFKINEFQNPLPDKLYAGGDIEYLPWENQEVSPSIVQELLEKTEQLYSLLKVELDLKISHDKYISYEIGHKIGLALEQELQILQMETEEARQLYLIQHLDKAIPVVADMERTKERIRMNGHFKNLDPLNF